MSIASRIVGPHPEVSTEVDWTAFLRGHGLDIAAAHPTWFRRDATRRALVGLNLAHDVDGERVVTPAYVKLHESAARHREVVDKWRTMRPRPTPLGPGFVDLEGENAVLVIHPNDGAMRFLNQVIDLDKFKRLSDWSTLWGGPCRVRARRSRIERLSYKPEHRLVQRVRLALVDDSTGEKARRDLIVRAFPDRRARRLERLVNELQQLGLGDVVPAQRGTLLDGRVHLEDAVDGVELAALLERGSVPIAGVVEAVGRLHGTRATCVAERSTEAELADALRFLAGIGGPVAVEVAHLIAERTPESSRRASTLHGDLHPRQLLVGERVRLVDFERAAVGDPLIDVGRFIAELEASKDAASSGELRAALLEDASRRHGEVDGELPFFIAAGLVQIAAMRHRRAGWSDSVGSESLLLRAAEHLRRSPARTTSSVSLNREWVTLHPGRRSKWPGVASIGGADVPGLFGRDSGEFEACEPGRDSGLPSLPRWLGKGTLVSYRAGSRATIRIEDEEGRALFAKVLRPGRGQAALEAAREVRSAVAGRVATPLAESSDDGDVVVLHQVPGDSLRSSLEQGAEIDERVLGEGLARFQEPEPPSSLPAREERVPWNWVARTCRAFPSIASELTTLTVRVRRLLAETRDRREVLVHGDLHTGNILIDRRVVGIIDVDGCGRGEPAIDVGNLAAELTVSMMLLDQKGASAAGDALVLAYLDAGGTASEQRIDACRLNTLLRLSCVYSFRRLSGDLPTRLRRRVRRHLEDGR